MGGTPGASGAVSATGFAKGDGGDEDAATRAAGAAVVATFAVTCARPVPGSVAEAGVGAVAARGVATAARGSTVCGAAGAAATGPASAGVEGSSFDGFSPGPPAVMGPGACEAPGACAEPGVPASGMETEVAGPSDGALRPVDPVCEGVTAGVAAATARGAGRGALRGGGAAASATSANDGPCAGVGASGRDGGGERTKLADEAAVDDMARDGEDGRERMLRRRFDPAHASRAPSGEGGAFPLPAMDPPRPYPLAG